MPQQSAEALVEERVERLKVISQRRNELLREIYLMMKRRQNCGSVLTQDDSEDDNGLHVFLEKFDLNKDLDSSFISNLAPRDFFGNTFSRLTRGKSAACREGGSENVSISQQLTTSLRREASKSQSVDREAMEIDDSSSHHRLSPLEEEAESDDILGVAPPEGTPPRIHSTPLLPQLQDVDDDDEPDELDIIGLPQPLHARRSHIYRNRSPLRKQPSMQSVSRTSSSPEISNQEVFLSQESSNRQDVTLDIVDSSPGPVLNQEQSPPPTAAPELPPSPNAQVLSRLQGPLVHSVAVEVTQFKPLFSIPAPPPIELPPFFEFDEPPQAPTQTTPKHASMFQPLPFNPNYTLPSLKNLPVEFTRKYRSLRQRKREREREKGEKGLEKSDARKEDWAPMGLNKWGATIRTNPVWKRVAKAPKCLTTRDWNVAMTELRLLRALERIENLKDLGKWSYRQPKKHRGIGGLMKTHWDYLLDEMKWMRVDFSEERKWKFVLAFNLSTAVLEWHAAGSAEERFKSGMCVKWKGARYRTEDQEAAFSQEMDIDERPFDRTAHKFTPGADESDNDYEEADAEQQNISDSLDTSNLVKEALESVVQSPDEDSQGQEGSVGNIKLKLEDVDDAFALQASLNNEEADSMNVDSQQGSNSEIAAPKEEDIQQEAALGIRPTSSNPVMGYQQTVCDGRPSASSIPNPKSNVYEPLRKSIAYSDIRKLFLDADDFDLVKSFADLSTDGKPFEPSLPPPDLTEIFPDLPVYEMFDVASPSASGSSTESKKKSDKKSDRHDPHKRTEDTMYNKLTPVARFMHYKPTLISALQPAHHFRSGRWSGTENVPVAVDYEGPANKNTEDISCSLFEGSKPPATGTPFLPTPPKDPKRRIEHTWTSSEDILLRILANRYLNNWSLISDSFNSSRVTISTDRRTAWDCYERWCTRWSGRPVPTAFATDLTPGDTQSSPTQIQMTTRGVKRLASVGTALESPSAGSSRESKKRRRHVLMHETVRKAARKREAVQKAAMVQRKPAAIHDTHGQYNKLPVHTPAELSRMKAEKEIQDAREYQRRKQEELVRAQQQQQQQQQLARVPNVLQTPSQQAHTVMLPTQPVAGPRPPAPVQQVQQIRQQVNISQQQRIGTPAAAANSRLSPQQQQQMLQAHAAQARALAAAQAQAQVQGQMQAQNSVHAQSLNVSNGINGIPVSTNGSHLSPPYNMRAGTSSPALPQQGSPLRAAATPANAVNSPRPPSAQPQVAMIPVSQVPGNTIPRLPNNISHYYHVASSMQGTQFTAEQMEQAMRLQNFIQTRQAPISQLPQNNQYNPQG